MRIVPAAPVPARPTSVLPAHASPTAIVCAALMLALVFLALRIAVAFGQSPFPDCSFIGDSVDGRLPDLRNPRGLTAS